MSNGNISLKFGGKTPIRIYFLDNSSKMFLIDENMTVLSIIDQILSKFDIHEYLRQSMIIAPYFSLYESLDGKSIGRVLSNQSILLDITQ